MDGITEFITAANNAAYELNKPVEGDYIDEKDGLWHCGKCRTPKQAEVFFMGQRLTPFCMCACRSAAVQRERDREAERERQMMISRLREDAFPRYSEYSRMTFENDDGGNDKLINAAKQYVAKFDDFKRQGKGLLLYGNCGTGKTYLAACIANALIDKGIRVKFTTLAKIVNKLQGSFDGRSEFYDDLRSVPLLIIDDFKAEHQTEFMQETAFEVINGRAEACLPLIITTNLTADKIKARHDNTSENADKIKACHDNAADNATNRILSRLLGMTVPVEVKGADRRREIIKHDYKADLAALGL